MLLRARRNPSGLPGQKQRLWQANMLRPFFEPFSCSLSPRRRTSSEILHSEPTSAQNEKQLNSRSAQCLDDICCSIRDIDSPWEMKRSQ